jgi:Gpi18-like mannosyltransferase
LNAEAAPKWEGLKAGVLAWLVFRLPLELWLGFGAGGIPQGPGALGMPPLDGPRWFHAWLRWDSGWYVRLIRDGYSYSPCLLPTDPCQQTTIAFFPLYPMVTRVFTWVLPLPIASFVVTHVALVLALWGLWELGKKFFGPEGGERAAVALLAFPSAIFVSAGYAEAVLIALVAWAFVFFERRQLWPLALVIAGAVLARSHGALLA